MAIVAWIEDEAAANAITSRRARYPNVALLFYLLFGSLYAWTGFTELGYPHSWTSYLKIAGGLSWIVIGFIPRKSSPKLTVPLEVHFDENGIDVDGRGTISNGLGQPAMTRHYPWSAIRSVEIANDALIIHFGVARPILVPKSALGANVDATIRLIYDHLVSTKNLVATPLNRLAVIANTRRNASA